MNLRTEGFELGNLPEWNLCFLGEHLPSKAPTVQSHISIGHRPRYNPAEPALITGYEPPYLWVLQPHHTNSNGRTTPETTASGSTWDDRLIAEDRPRVRVRLLNGRAGDWRKAGPTDRDNAQHWAQPDRAAAARESTR